MSDSGRANSPTSPARRKPRKLAVRSKLSVDMGDSRRGEQPAAGHMDAPAGNEEATDTFDRSDDQLPALPGGDDSYLQDTTPSFMHRSDDPSDPFPHSDESHSMDEHAMSKHLQDVESSFLPETASVPSQNDQMLGVDDTFVELGKPGRTPPPDEMLAALTSPQYEFGRPGRHLLSPAASEPNNSQGWNWNYRYHGNNEEMGSSRSTGNEEEMRYNEGLGNEEDYEYNEEVASDEERDETEDSLSPAQAAAHRSHRRDMSSASAITIQPTRAQSVSIRSSTANTPSNSRPTTPSTQNSRPGTASTRAESSPQAQNVPLPQSTVDSPTSESQLSTPRRSARPAFGRRLTSQISAFSNRTLSSGFSGSDAGAGADYALQTGGSALGIPPQRGSLRTSNFVNRLPSLGSDASYLTRDADNFPTLGRLGASISRDRLSTRLEEEEPATPRPNSSRNEVPTDTVLAQRVQDIQVPETVARDFRARNPSLMTDRRPASSDGPATGLDRPRRTLTLKEQNGKIDKLTKENFDLKLKIHFLDQALRSHSDEGLQELIDKNVQYQTDLANERKETQSMRRKMRELERRNKELEGSLADAQSTKSSADNHTTDDDDDPTLQAEMHEEILYLRQQLDHSENSVTTLREEMLTEKLEKRKMAEHMRSMAGNRAEDNTGVRETMDMWQDLLNAETGRREQAEEDVRKMREELSGLRIERASPAANRVDKRSHRNSRLSHAQAVDDESEYTNGVNGSESSATLVEQLKHENTELRRDLGAQTSMLTSRNRERERLQQEIEDLKLLQRKSDGSRSVTGDSIFERSISRAHQRAPSRSGESDHTAVTEAERDDWDKKEGQLRDQNAELRLKFQELERTHGTYLGYVSALENDFQEMEQELNDVGEDFRSAVVERDEALQSSEELKGDYERMEQEAVAEIERLEKDMDSLHNQLQDVQRKLQRTQTKLEHSTDGYKGLQGELREITNSVMNLEDEKQSNMRTIETLEQQIAETEDELQKWEAKCKELDQKNRKLEITQESLHSEITFLREEQEGDKIKIGELEDALNAAQQTIQDEQEKLREMEDEIMQERQQRDVLENQSKEEVQKVLDGLNNETGKSKDEIRKLRRALSAKEVEAGSWRQRLEEFEQGFRDVLGDPDGSKQSMLGEVEKLQRELETTANQLDRVKMDLADKDRLLRHRDGLLESTSLESRRLSDLLDKERSARRHDLDQFERSSRGQATNIRTIAHHESRVLELETAYSQDKRKMAASEQQFREQLTERNTLLLAIWNRLSTLCGAEWAQQHSLVNGQIPSSETITKAFPNFNKNVVSAMKKIEALMGDFKMRIRGAEKDLWRDYQTLEQNLELRIRRMDSLEQAVQDAQVRMAEEAAKRPQASRSVSSKTIKSTEEISKLKTEVKVLKTELKFHRQHPSAMAQQMLHQQNQSMNPGLSRQQSQGGQSIASTATKPGSPARAIMSTLLRHHSTSAVEHLQPSSNSQGGDENNHSGGRHSSQSIVLASPPIQPSEQRWIHRLKEMERRLKAEREARLLDRRGARQRLEEGRVENEELRLMLEREKQRGSEAQAEDEGSEDEEL